VTDLNDLSFAELRAEFQSNHSTGVDGYKTLAKKIYGSDVGEHEREVVKHWYVVECFRRGVTPL